MTGRSQEALYAGLDLELSWSESELPQVARTKHVHGLHPYLGKFVPQLVEVFLERYFAAGDTVYDPFVGSGTTLVEANARRVRAVGCDISAFNCLLSRVKTTRYALASVELALRVASEDARRDDDDLSGEATPWLRSWFAPQALQELLRYRRAIRELDDPAWDLARVVLSRAARSARRTRHFDLDFPREPANAPYYCHKHKRTCRPVDEAGKFLRRYTHNTMRRLREFSTLRTQAQVEVLHADARTVELPWRPDGVITSPPYPGLIDYHEQHRYAYELLGLVDRGPAEIGAASGGTTRAALERYVDAMTEVFGNTRRRLALDAPVVVVVNDSRDLYPTILERSGLRLERRLTRHVNRRTGRRAGEFFEHVLVCHVARR